MFWNQLKKKKKKSERAREEKKREWELECFWKREKKKIKGGGVDIGQRVWGEKKKETKKKRRNETYGRNEMRERRNNIKNKKS